MSNPTQIVERYLAAWNERDPKRRSDLIAKTYTEARATSTRTAAV